MEEWGIWDGIWNEWWTGKSDLIFHTAIKEVALAQLFQIYEHWLARDGVGFFSVKSFQTGEIIHTEYPGQAHANWEHQVAMRHPW